MSKILVAVVVVFGALALAQEPVATVNGEPISRDELNQLTDLSRIVLTLYQQFPNFVQTLLLTDEGKAFLDRYERDMLEKIILRKIQLQEARALGIVPDEESVAAETEETLKQIMAQYSLTEEDLASQLLLQGTTLDAFRADIARHVREQLLIEALQAYVTAEATVSEEEIQAYYDNNPDRFTDASGNKTPFADVHDKIAALILSEKRSAIWQAWLSEARQRAQVEINL
ncbi:SurA N-terminal domain-containing protein [Candidatus Bipolaricaulota bacterium]|nr:SurA N-terminal domain-containing protein [Candidatus Bipolaricaulota bacterium]